FFLRVVLRFGLSVSIPSSYSPLLNGQIYHRPSVKLNLGLSIGRLPLLKTFCAWWLKEVTPNWGGSRQDARSLILRKEEVDAWAKTVSRWNKFLEHKQQYRQPPFGG